MTVHNGKYPAHAEHRRHDRLLISRFAMDDAYPGERDEARALIESCAECAALAVDIRLIASSMKQLPSASRPRDFTITQEQADRLRGSRLSRWLRTLAAPGWATLRPVAGVALSIGLVMAVVGSVLPSYSPAAAPQDERLQSVAGNESPAAVSTGAPAAVPTGAPAAESTGAAPAASAAPAPAVADGRTSTDESSAPAEGAGAPEGAPDVAPMAQTSEDPTTRDLSEVYVAPSADDTSVGPLDYAAAPTPADPARNLLIYGGLAIAALSLAVLALAWLARRYVADPLLR